MLPSVVYSLQNMVNGGGIIFEYKCYYASVVRRFRITCLGFTVRLCMLFLQAELCLQIKNFMMTFSVTFGCLVYLTTLPRTTIVWYLVESETMYEKSLFSS